MQGEIGCSYGRNLDVERCTVFCLSKGHLAPPGCLKMPAQDSQHDEKWRYAQPVLAWYQPSGKNKEASEAKAHDTAHVSMQ
eukprot:3735891-Amphidinium_carterae.1